MMVYRIIMIIHEKCHYHHQIMIMIILKNQVEKIIFKINYWFFFAKDFISNLNHIDSSPESSSRSSGIYSTNDLHLSSSSSEFYPTFLTNKLLSSSNFYSNILYKQIIHLFFF